MPTRLPFLFVLSLLLSNHFLFAQSLPLYPIGLVTANDAAGVTDSVGVECQIAGIVHTPDYLANIPIILRFAVMDSSGGIWVEGFGFGLNYTPVQGDSIIIEGIITQEEGHTYMDPSSISLVSTGNPLLNPRVVPFLSEDDEGELVRLDTFKLVDPAQWGQGGFFGFSVDITNNADTLPMNVLAGVSLFTAPAPVGFFSVIGVPYQSDLVLPFLEGYSILPRDTSDIIEIQIPTVNLPPAKEVWEFVGNTQLLVSLLDPPSDTVVVEVALSPLSTATNGLDFLWNDTTLVFPPNATAPIALTVTILDDTVAEDVESIYFSLQNASSNALPGNALTHIDLIDDDYPLYPIQQVTSLDTINGEADSIGTRCELVGTVYGVNLDAPLNGGLQFTLIDSTDGIEIVADRQFAYTVTEGDLLRVQGTIGQDRGMTQMVLDTLFLEGSGQALKTPTVVGSLGEETDSDLIRLEYVRLTPDGVQNWQPNPGPFGGGFSVEVTNIEDTFQVRIDREVADVYNSSPPTGWLCLTGIGDQQSPNFPPYLEGYQIMPRYLADIEFKPPPLVGFVATVDTVRESDGTIKIPLFQDNGNPDVTLLNVSVVAGLSTALEGVDFSILNNVQLSGLGTSTDSLSFKLLDDLEVEGDETVVLFISSATNNATIVQQNISIVIQDDLTDPIENVLPVNAVKVFPNPGKDQVRIESESPILSVSLSNMLGQKYQEIWSNVRNGELHTAQLPTGIYQLKVETRAGTWMGKWVRE